jgi:hypothetical protein
MIDTNISLNMENPKKSFDEVCLARCCVIATESLNPEEFDSFIVAYNTLIERRTLQNKPISYGD